MHPAAKAFLGGLARIGARSFAAAVDVALSEAEGVLDDVSSRVRSGRKRAQGIGRPNAHVQVDVVDPTGKTETADAELVDD